jgi:hypothetical protein
MYIYHIVAHVVLSGGPHGKRVMANVQSERMLALNTATSEHMKRVFEKFNP